MQLTKTHKIVISIVILAILLGLYIAFDIKSKKTNVNTQDNNPAVTTATTTDSAGVQVTQGSGSYTVVQVPTTSTKTVPQPIPDLTRKVTVQNSVSLPVDVQATTLQKISDIQTSLKKDPSYLAGWIDLGIYEKMMGDYNGAVESWKYASKLIPTDYISLANLGNLYAYFLKDNAQAENYYKQAIANGPTMSYLYVQFAEVYRDIFKDSAKALAVVEQGLAKIPTDSNLLQLKASLTK